MKRSVLMALALAALSGALAAQSRLEVSRLFGDLPLTLIDTPKGAEYSSYLYSTPEGHELLVQCRKDSSVFAFIAHPAKSGTPETGRRAFVKRVMTNAFGSDTTLAAWFQRSVETQQPSSRHLSRDGWSFTLLSFDKRISRLVVNARSSFRR
jgi:hypothetical protein